MTHDAFVFDFTTMSANITIASVCDEIKQMLLQKNISYGNSALEPVRIFSKSDDIEGLYVRIDDKLSRIKRGSGLSSGDEDVLNDLIGYMVLLKIALRKKTNNDKIHIGPYYASTEGHDVITFGSNPAYGSASSTFDGSWDGSDIDAIYAFDFTHRSPD